LKVLHIEQFRFPLPEGHPFPIEKYERLYQRVVEAAIVGPQDLCVPRAATDREIRLAHDPQYLDRAEHGQLTSQEMRRIGFPWSAELMERARRSCGATIEACRGALVDGLAVSLSGGTHHAFRDHGQGYCLYNDSAIASRTMQEEGRVRRVVIIDCDAHQGNGTAAILRGDPTVFTFSIHGKNSFPPRKETSDLDVPLEDDIDDTAYLRALEEGVHRAIQSARGDLAVYLAGADPYVDDRYGRLGLSKEGLAERDRVVLRECRNQGIPVAITMAGGYARQVGDTVDIHFQTVKTAADLARKG
jgi:acetoin utilization deacetylase AcuC-like enzyme